MKYQINGRAASVRKPALRFCQTNTCTMPTQTPKHIFFFFYLCKIYQCSIRKGFQSNLIFARNRKSRCKKSVRDFRTLTYLYILNFLKETSLYCPLTTGPEPKFVLLRRYCICQQLLTPNSTITQTSRPLL